MCGDSRMRCVVSPDSYFILFKADMHQEYEIFDQKEKPDRLALGGIYEVLGEEKDCYILKPETGSKYEFFRTPKFYLKVYDEKKYDYNVSDIVIFAPVCSEKEIKTITYNDTLIIGHKYKIYRVINHYYLQLINEYGDISIPIRFCDVKKDKGDDCK